MAEVKNPQILRTITLLITVCFVSIPAYAQYSGGTGEPNDPYQIATAADLIALGVTPDDYDKHFILTADIDLDPNLPGRIVFNGAVIALSGWGPRFTGLFDGNGHTISHLTIRGTDNLGLFGYLSRPASVENLGLADVNITGSGPGTRIGALVAYSHSGEVIRCYSTGVISCFGAWSSPVGGLVGLNAGTVKQCYSTAIVRGNRMVGGLVGGNYRDVIQCYATGSVNGGQDTGGLVGYNFRGNVLHSVWDVDASGLSASDGGVGLTTAEMMDPYMLGLNGFANDPNWVVNAGHDYPRLAWEGTPGGIIPEPNIDWLTGNGTEQTPYRIDTADQLLLLGRASALCDEHFILDDDIDLDPNLPGRHIFRQALIPVFTGVFDGNHHTISHLTIKGKDCLGLFGIIGGEVSNLGMVDCSIVATGSNVGGMVGRNSRGNVTRCHSTGAVSGNFDVGGLAGTNEWGTVTQCFSEVVVVGGSRVGGLVGYNWGGAVNACYSTGAVSSDHGAGGLVGSNDSGVITQCHSAGPVTGTGERVGGLVGGSDGDVIASFWDTETSGQTISDGGTGKTTAEMQTGETFLKWGTCGNEGVWTIDEGKDYPRLWWENRAGEPIRMPDLPNLLLGGGMEKDPFLIHTSEELNLVGMYPCEWDKHFKLTADIDLSGFDGKQGRLSFNTIGDSVNAFTGVFDGNKKAIRSLTRPLFGYVEGTVRGLRLVDPNCTGSPIESNSGIITDCGVQGGSVRGSGGLVGENWGGHIISSYSTAMVSSTGNRIGGLVGFNTGDIVASYSAGSVSGTTSVGGLVGANGNEYFSGNVTQCYSTGSVTGDYSVGGLVGYGGHGQGRIWLSYSTGAVSGNSDVGGLVGMKGSNRVKQCYSTGAITGTGWGTGGLMGENYGNLMDCYSMGVVKGTSSVGGLVGTNGDLWTGYDIRSGYITRCYSSCLVDGSWAAGLGGLCGAAGGSSIDSFWDIETSGQITSDGGTGKTTAEMQTASTFLDAGWDFVGETTDGTEDIWWIDEGRDYPRLWWEGLEQ